MSAGPEGSNPLVSAAPALVSAIAMRRLGEETAANQRRYQLVVTVVVVSLALVGALIGLAFGAWPVGLGAGIAVGVLLVAFAPGVGERLALRTLGAEPADPKRFPRYQNLVEGLCEELGMPLPKLWVVDSDAANALALGRNPTEATVVVTTGLLALLNRVELEGVLAAELSHIRASSARLGSAAVPLGGAGGLLLEARRRGGNPLLGAAAWVLLVLVPLRWLAVPVQRHVLADQGAAYLTRYPPGLIAALRKLGSQPGGATLSNLGLNHLWLVDPAPAPGPVAAPDRFFASHPPLEERLENLRDL
jgi:heat shock protein HtpX